MEGLRSNDRLSPNSTQPHIAVPTAVRYSASPTVFATLKFQIWFCTSSSRETLYKAIRSGPWMLCGHLVYVGVLPALATFTTHERALYIAILSSTFAYCHPCKRPGTLANSDPLRICISNYSSQQKSTNEFSYYKNCLRSKVNYTQANSEMLTQQRQI